MLKGKKIRRIRGEQLIHRALGIGVCLWITHKPCLQEAISI